MTYRLALSHLKTGNDKDAAIWFETLRMVVIDTLTIAIIIFLY